MENLTFSNDLRPSVDDLEAVAVVVVDDAGAVAYASRTATALLGPPLGGLAAGEAVELAREDGEILQPSDHPAFVAMRTGASVRAAVIGLRNPGEAIRWFRVDATSKDRRTTCTFVEVSSLIGHEPQPSNATPEAWTWFESPLPVIVFDHKSLDVLTVNPEAMRFYGFSRREFGARRITDLFTTAEEAERFVGEIRPRPAGSEYTGRWQHRLKDGRLLDVQCLGRVLRWNRRLVSLVFVLDLANERHLERQLRQSQKMEAVGRLAGGVAHDFNNLLTAITGYTDMLAEALPPDGKLREYATQVQAAADQATALTQQLLAFGRRQVLFPRILDLNEVVRDIELILRRVIGEDIEFSAAPEPTLGHVFADRGQLSQVIMNLAVNARDAMPRGGRLRIETRNTELDERYAAVHPGSRVGRFVMLSVTDTGIGMDTETLGRLFEPFYTTKPVGEGTGLGLSTVYGIVKQSEGYITVSSEPGAGSSFQIYLPMFEEPAEAAGVPLPLPAVAGGSETILLVEDDPTVRDLVGAVLTTHGYRVLLAESAELALALCEQPGATPDLLLTDIVMPRISGPELALKVRERHQATRVLFLSGYADDTVERHVGAHEAWQLLRKPFRPDDLARSVRKALDGPPEAGSLRPSGLPSAD